MPTEGVEQVNVDAAVGALGAIMGVIWVVSIAVFIFSVIVGWRIFSKAGKPGIASIVPIWNAIVLLQIAGKPGWWFILLCIPVVNIVIAILAAIGLARNFGKGGGFAAGLILLGFIFYPILAFGSAQYVGEGAVADNQ